MFAEFYSKGSPLVSKETSLGRNQYLYQGEGRLWDFGGWKEGSVVRGNGSDMGWGIIRRVIVGG